MPRKTNIGTKVAHVTRDSDTTFKVTRPLWLVVLALAGQHGHTVMVTYPYAYMTYSVTTCRPGRGHIVAAARLQLVIAANQTDACTAFFVRVHYTAGARQFAVNRKVALTYFVPPCSFVHLS